MCSSIIIYFAFYRQILPKPTSAATSSVTGDKNVATIYDANASSSKKKNGANNDDGDAVNIVPIEKQKALENVFKKQNNNNKENFAKNNNNVLEVEKFSNINPHSLKNILKNMQEVGPTKITNDNTTSDFPPRLQQIADVWKELKIVENDINGGVNQEKIDILKHTLKMLKMIIQQFQINQTVVSADKEDVEALVKKVVSLNEKLEKMSKDIQEIEEKLKNKNDDTDEDELQNLSEDEIRSKIDVIFVDEPVEVLDSPFIIYLHAGIHRRNPITEDDYDAFLKYILYKSCDERYISWHGFGSGRCIIG